MRRMWSWALSGLIVLSAVITPAPVRAAAPSGVTIDAPGAPVITRTGVDLPVRYTYTSEPSVPDSSVVLITLRHESGDTSLEIFAAEAVPDGVNITRETAVPIPPDAQDGIYDLVVEVRNEDGSASDTAAGRVRVDGIAPELVDVVVDPITFRDGVRITGAATDNIDGDAAWNIKVMFHIGGDSYDVYLDESGTGAFDVTWDGLDFDGKPVAELPFIVQITATDAAGNVTREEISIVADRTPPVIAPLTLSSPAFAPDKDVLTITTTISEALPHTLRIYREGETDPIRTIAVTTAATSVHITWDGRDDDGTMQPRGNYTLELEATDAAGNTATVQATVAIDPTRPLLANVSVHPGIIAPDVQDAVNTIRFQAQADKGGTYRIQIVNGRDEVLGELTFDARSGGGSGSPKAGELALDFGGKLGGVPLADGEYRAVITFTDEAGNESLPSTVKFIVDRKIPNAPRIFGLPTKTGSNRILISWARHPGADANGIGGYRLERKLSSETAWTTIATLPASTKEYRDSGLKAGRYDYRVIAIDTAGNAAASEIATVEVILSIEPPVISELPRYRNTDSVVFSWQRSPSEGVQGYYIVRRKDGIAMPEVVVDANTTEWRETGLVDLSRYEFSVIAYDALGNQAESEIRVVEVDRTPPDPFEVEDIPAFTNDKVDLKWSLPSDPGSGLDRIVVLYSTDGVKFTQLVELPPSDTSYKVTPSETQKYWRIRIYDRAGNYRESRRVGTAVDSTPPEIGLSVDPVQFENLRVSWYISDNNAVQSMQMLWKIGDGEWHEWVDKDGSPIRTQSGSLPFTGRNNTTHYFKIIAHDVAGNRIEREVSHHIHFRRATVLEPTYYYRGTGVYDVAVGILSAGEEVALLEEGTPYDKVGLKNGEVVYVMRGKLLKEIEVFVGGEQVLFDVAPVIVNDRTLVPIRHIAEALGAEVTWDNALRMARIRMADKEILVRIGDKIATVNGTWVELDAAAEIRGDRTFVPLRFVAESLGLTVLWDQSSRTVYLR